MRQRRLYTLCAGLLLLATTTSAANDNSSQGHTGDSASANDPRQAMSMRPCVPHPDIQQGCAHACDPDVHFM